MISQLSCDEVHFSAKKAKTIDDLKRKNRLFNDEELKLLKKSLSEGGQNQKDALSIMEDQVELLEERFANDISNKKHKTKILTRYANMLDVVLKQNELESTEKVLRMFNRLESLAPHSTKFNEKLVKKLKPLLEKSAADKTPLDLIETISIFASRCSQRTEKQIYVLLKQKLNDTFFAPSILDSLHNFAKNENSLNDILVSTKPLETSPLPEVQKSVLNMHYELFRNEITPKTEELRKTAVGFIEKCLTSNDWTVKESAASICRMYRYAKDKTVQERIFGVLESKVPLIDDFTKDASSYIADALTDFAKIINKEETTLKTINLLKAIYEKTLDFRVLNDFDEVPIKSEAGKNLAVQILEDFKECKGIILPNEKHYFRIKTILEKLSKLKFRGI